MNRWLQHITTLSLLLLAPVSVVAAGLTGTWTCEFGDTMIIDAANAEFRARFNFKQGRIIGELHGDTVEGVWVQGNESSKGRCKEKRDGSSDWGTIQLTFSGDSYKGKWGYCDGNLSYKLSGKRMDQAANKVIKKSATYRIGASVLPFDRSAMQPNDWQPWKLELTDSYLKPYGLTIADGKRFEKKLQEIAGVIKAAPVLNPSLGCSPRLAPALDSVSDERDPRSKKEPLHGSMLLGCFVLDEVVRKKNGVKVKEYVIGETRQAKISINDPHALILGAAGWNNLGTNGLNPFDRIFPEPDRIGEQAGFPIFSGYSNAPDTTSALGFFYLSRKNVPPYLPVSRERLLKVLAAKAAEICASGRGGSGKQNDQNMLDSLNKQLKELKAGERDQQACYLHKSPDSGWGTPAFEGAVALGTPGCVPVVRLNPALIDPKLPRTTPQLVVVKEFLDIESSAYPNKRVDTWTTLQTIIQTDWGTVRDLLDKP